MGVCNRLTYISSRKGVDTCSTVSSNSKIEADVVCH